MTKIKKSADILAQKILNEKDIKLIITRLNSMDSDTAGVVQKLVHAGVYWRLTPEQIERGRKWLLNQWKTPRGIERKNSPFGWREEEVIERMDTIVLSGFTDTGSAGYPYYTATWVIYGKNGKSFEYVRHAGGCKVIG